MQGKEAIVKLLEQAGVEVVFGLCGDTSLPYYEAFYDLKPNIKHILTRDERSAGYMADAYARLSGRVGVCEGPSGGGVTYIIPGVAEANQSSVPLICLTSDIDSRHRWRGTLTELDQDALFQPITVYTNTPDEAADLPHTFREAFKRSVSGAMGAGHIGLALNVQEAEIADDDVFIDGRYGRYPAFRQAPGSQSVAQAVQTLLAAEKPLIVAGGGVIRSEAWPELTAFAEMLGCPVATSISGKGAIAEDHPFALGVIGSNGGLPYRHRVVKEADLIFYIGCACGSVVTEKWTLPRPGSVQVMQLDVSPNAIGRNYPVTDALVCDAKLGLMALNEALFSGLKGQRAARWPEGLIPGLRKAYMDGVEGLTSDEIPIRPERFVTELRKAMPDDGVVVCDPGTPTPFFAAYFTLHRAGRWFVTNRAHGALGYSLPAAVGAHFACPDKKIVAVMGDGSFGFTCGELETIARYRIPLVLVVVANGGYGWIKAGQKAMGGKYFAVDFTMADHAKIAESFNVTGRRVEDPKDLGAALEWAIALNEPVLLDVVMQPLHEAAAPVSKWIA
jgi:acetolactate synthase-1/2/3 large subunit